MTLESQKNPKLIIVMGVSGSGKSSIAQLLANRLQYPFLEADDFHSQQAKTLMADNQPLTDMMRIPWIKRICQKLIQLNTEQQNVVLAYSGLKRTHRDQFRRLGFQVRFIWLNGNWKIIERRMANRENHFVSSTFLQSQIAALEPPEAEESDVRLIDIDGSIDQVFESVYLCSEEFINHCKNKSKDH